LLVDGRKSEHAVDGGRFFEPSRNVLSGPKDGSEHAGSCREHLAQEKNLGREV
jgi:hypothetical protein